MVLVLNNLFVLNIWGEDFVFFGNEFFEWNFLLFVLRRFVYDYKFFIFL